MKRVPIAEVCSINPRLSAALASQKDREVDFVPMANLGEDGRITLNGSRKLGEVLKGYTYFENGDVLVAKITPCMENGKAAYVHNLSHGIAFGSTEFHVLRPNPGVEPRYLFYMVWTPYFRREAAQNMTGTAGQQRVPASFFERFEIPLPPLPEQKRIADILDRADAIRRKRGEAVGLCGRIPTGRFFELFGDPHANPHGWPTKQLKELVVADDKINYGVVQPGVDFPGGVPIVRVGDLQNLRVSVEDLKRIDPLIEKDYTRSRLVGDEVLIACVGSIGLIALADERVRGFNIVRAVARVRCSNAIDRLYLAAYLATPAIQKYFYQATRTVSQPTLNIKQIEETPIHVPPLELQRQFAKYITRQQESLQRLEMASTEVTQLFNSLVQRAFRGAL